MIEASQFLIFMVYFVPPQLLAKLRLYWHTQAEIFLATLKTVTERECLVTESLETECVI